MVKQNTSEQTKFILLLTFLSCAIATLVASSLIGTAANAAQKTELRLYKVNKFGQGQRLRFTSKNSKLEGCQNLKFKRARVHRAVHYGFANCTLFAQKDCAKGSEVSARLGDDEPLQTALTQGHSWFLGAEEKDDPYAKYSKEERGKKVRSWSCVSS